MGVKIIRRGEVIPLIYRALKDRPGSAQDVARRAGLLKRTAWSMCAKLQREGFLKVVGRKRHYRSLARVYAIARPYVMQRSPQVGPRIRRPAQVEVSPAQQGGEQLCRLARAWPGAAEARA